MQKPKFEIGDRVKHYAYGKGTILGNYHKRGENYYWHIQYDNNTFGYNSESSLKLIEHPPIKTIADVLYMQWNGGLTNDSEDK